MSGAVVNMCKTGKLFQVMHVITDLAVVGFLQINAQSELHTVDIRHLSLKPKLVSKTSGRSVRGFKDHYGISFIVTVTH